MSGPKRWEWPCSVPGCKLASTFVQGWTCGLCLLCFVFVRDTGCIGDQQAATVGQLCTKRGEAKTTFGTGEFMLVNTGEGKPLASKHLLSTALYQLKPGDDMYDTEPCSVCACVCFTVCF